MTTPKVYVQVNVMQPADAVSRSMPRLPRQEAIRRMPISPHPILMRIIRAVTNLPVLLKKAALTNIEECAPMHAR